MKNTKTKLSDDKLFGKLTGKVLEQVESGKMKTRKYQTSELD